MAEPQIDPRLVDQTRREIGRLVGEIEQLANQELEPGEFYAETTRRIHTALAAEAAAIWMRTSQGNLVLQFQIGLPQINGLDERTRPAHDQVLRYVVTKREPTIVGPHSGPGDGSLNDEPVGIENPTPYLLVLAPVIVDEDIVGILEVFQRANRQASAQQGYLQFLRRISGEVAKFIKNGRYRNIVDQQQRWNQVEAFIRTIHGGLNPIQVSYLIVNEGKRLIQCERVTVGIRRGKKTKIIAISGQDVVEQRSNLVRRMTVLTDKVLKHGETLIYSGTVEEHWPGDVRKALEEYLDESGSKLVIVVPMPDNREFADRKGRADTALICEMIEDPASPDEMASKVEIVSRHGAVALANALEHDDIFLLGFWKILGKSTRWMRGRGLPKIAAVVALLAVVGGVLALYPYPLRLEGRGELVPEIRRTVYAPVTGTVREVRVEQGVTVPKEFPLVIMSSLDLEQREIEIDGKLRAAEAQKSDLEAKVNAGGEKDPRDEAELSRVKQELAGLEEQRRLLDTQRKQLELRSPIEGTVMDWKPRERLLDRPVEQGEPLLEVADIRGKWIVEVDLPETAITHIAKAEKDTGGDLDVEFILSAAPDTVYKGKLIEHGTQAHPVEQENFVQATIEINPDEELAKQVKEAAEEEKLRTRLSGIEVRAKVNCGDHPLGYVLFRELIDFIREYVFF